MPEPRGPLTNDVDELLRNAQLREELEPFVDESIDLVSMRSLPTVRENEYLASMLAWERAPALPIAQWFSPPLELPHPAQVDDPELHERLWRTIRRLHSQRIVLDFTDHLSDRELYCLIYRDILPAMEKRIESSRHFLHWDCSDTSGDQLVWLRYYATDEERQMWQEQTGEPLPPRDDPPYPRRLPHHPL